MAEPMPLAEVEDLSEWLGEPIAEDADRRRAAWALRLASELVRQEADRPDDWGAGADVPEPVKLVTLQAAARGYTNPESWRDERTDDWGGSGRPVQELGLYLTATERRMLAPYRVKKPGGIGVIATTRTPDRAPLAGWVSTVGGPLFPWY